MDPLLPSFEQRQIKAGIFDRLQRGAVRSLPVHGRSTGATIPPTDVSLVIDDGRGAGFSTVSIPIWSEIFIEGWLSWFR